MDIKKQVDVFAKGLVDFISEDELVEKLKNCEKTGAPLRIKYGADPSKPDLHLGHTVPLYKLRDLQDLGHSVVFLIGDFTALVGDPSMRSETRPMLTPKEVKENSQTYQEQVFKILDESKTEVVYNSSWLSQLTPLEFLNLTSKYTVARILERDDFQKRFQANIPISITEFMYPLLQGYDSVFLRNDLEIGGTDQKFNLLVGRELQRDWGMEPQVVMTLPIIEGTDGVQKMSKSLGNAVGIQEPPEEMFGKLMSVPDNLIVRYLTYLTRNDDATLQSYQQRLDDGENPRNLKASMAEEVVAQYYGSEKAKEASQHFDHVFKEKKIPDNIPEYEVSPESSRVIDLLFDHGLVSSKGEARRLIKQRGVKLNGEKVEDPELRVDFSEEVLLQCGKRKFARFRSLER